MPFYEWVYSCGNSEALLFGILLSPTVGLAQDEALHQRFNAVLAQHRIVGGGIAIVHGQQRATKFFFGVMRNGMHQRVDSKTSSNWASITKAMTEIAVLQLCDRGKLSLDDPAVRYLPELRQVHDDFGPIDAITLRNLLTYSVDFRNPMWPWDCDDPWTSTFSHPKSAHSDGRQAAIDGQLHPIHEARIV